MIGIHVALEGMHPLPLFFDNEINFSTRRTPDNQTMGRFCQASKTCCILNGRLIMMKSYFNFRRPNIKYNFN